jgi:hypothetical protein
MASDRRRGFEGWAKVHGDQAIRAPDRRAIAEDLFALAPDAEVDEGHIEELAKAYRERFAGAKKILLVTQIGEEILRWQIAPRSIRPMTADARREDDEVIGLEIDTLSSLGHIVNIPKPAPVPAKEPSVPALEAPKPKAPPPPPKPATPTPLPAPPLAPPVRPASSGTPRVATGSTGDWAASPPLAPPSAAPAAAPISVAPIAAPPPSERARSEGAIDWSVPVRPGGAAEPKLDLPDVPEQGLWAPLRGASPPAADEAPGADGIGDLALPLPPPQARRVSSRPPAAPVAAAIELAGHSQPPPSRGAPPPSPPGPPSAAPAAAPGPPVPIPVPLPAQPVGEGALAALDKITLPGPLAAIGSRLLAKVAGALVGTMVIATLLIRPSCLFGRSSVDVDGRFASKHLGVAISFPEPWKHERSLDDDESKGDWERSVSIFYQGVTVDEFVTQLTIVTMEHDDRPANEDDLRTVGASELAGTAQGRLCNTYDRYGGKAVRCVSISARMNRRYAMLEEYFLAGKRLVFARGLVEAIPGESMPTEEPALALVPGQQAPVRTGMGLMAEVDARKLEAILDAIEPLSED